MDRRAFIRGLSAIGLATATLRPGPARANSPGRVVVIGAGIVGASIAYNLSKRGCDVVLLDKAGPAAQASGNSFAWINASWYDQPDSYFALRTASLNEYHRWAAELDFPIRWGGSLEWYHSAEAQAEMAAGVEHIQQLGAPAWLIGRERVAEVEPELDLAGDVEVTWCRRDGAIDPRATTEALVAAVIGHGGSTTFPANVTGIRQSGDKVRVTAGAQTIEADRVVIAAGASANEVAALAGIETTIVNPPTPGVIVTTAPMAPLLNAIGYTTDSHFHQLPDGRVIAGEKAGPPDTTEHAAFLAGWPNEYPSAELAAEHASRVLTTASRYVPALGDAPVERVGVGWRPLPVDGLPVVGQVPGHPGVYVASMHSGVTLAPVIGHFAAMEILDGVRIEALADFRIERLQG
jgi:glycine/D-amino acid oxidase-like deaminating enzyme